MNRIIINTVDPASGLRFGSYALDEINFLTNSFLGQISAYLYVNGVLQTVSFLSRGQEDLEVRPRIIEELIGLVRSVGVFDKISYWRLTFFERIKTILFFRLF